MSVSVIYLAVTASFIGFDIVTGLLAALILGTFKSQIMREGAGHKLGELMAMILMYAIQFGLPYLGIGISIPLVQSVCAYLVFMEVGSIIENICKLNPDLRDKLTSIYKQLPRKDLSDEDDHTPNVTAVTADRGEIVEHMLRHAASVGISASEAAAAFGKPEDKCDPDKDKEE